MSKTRTLQIVRGIMLAIQEGCSQEDVIKVACQYGRSWNQTKEETEEVLKKTLSELI